MTTRQYPSPLNLPSCVSFLFRCTSRTERCTRQPQWRSTFYSIYILAGAMQAQLQTARGPSVPSPTQNLSSSPDLSSSQILQLQVLMSQPQRDIRKGWQNANEYLLCIFCSPGQSIGSLTTLIYFHFLRHIGLSTFWLE